MAKIDVNSNKSAVLAAVTQNGRALRYASEPLKGDHEIVLAAVTQKGWALRYASEPLKDDREIVLAAVTQEGSALYYASERLKNDNILQRLVKLKSPEAAVQFRALEPLKNKLKQETNTDRKTSAAKMIADIEEAILCSHESDEFDFEEAFNQAVNEAKPVLEQQTGWKKLIDAVANTILSLFRALRGEQNQGRLENRFSFFTNPNPVQKEIEEVKATIFPKQ